MLILLEENQRKIFSKYKYTISSFAIIVVIFLIFTPVMLAQAKSTFEDSLISQTVQESEFLRLAHACCITASLPMLLDIALDATGKQRKISGENGTLERISTYFGLIFPSLIFFSFFDTELMTPVFVAISQAQAPFMAVLLWSSASRELTQKAPKLSIAIFLSMVVLTVRNSVQMFSLYSRISGGEILISVLSICQLIVVFAATYVYIQLTVKGMDPRRGFSFDEIQCTVSLLCIVLFSLCSPLLAWSIGLYDWRNGDESAFVTLAAVQLAVIIAITALPGRLARMSVETLSEEMHSLKKIFIRYVSHELRSPLNVIHAGLDILLDELRESKWSRRTLAVATDLVEDILASSETAVNILNDLQYYEYMADGSFHLELCWKPLNKLIENKFRWASFMAKRKHIVFNIIDETSEAAAALVSLADFPEEEAETNALAGKALFGTKISQEFTQRTKMSVQYSTLATAFLHYDEAKVDQVIRHLLTNAFKFTPANGFVTMKLSYVPADHDDSKFGSTMGSLRVEVADSGQGIATIEKDKIFRDPEQFDRNELLGGGGCGLGLCISRKIINMHNGCLGVHSQGTGKGSVFFFELPLYRSRPHETMEGDFSAHLDPDGTMDLSLTTAQRISFLQKLQHRFHNHIDGEQGGEEGEGEGEDGVGRVETSYPGAALIHGLTDEETEENESLALRRIVRQRRRSSYMNAEDSFSDTRSSISRSRKSNASFQFHGSNKMHTSRVAPTERIFTALREIEHLSSRGEDDNDKDFPSVKSDDCALSKIDDDVIEPPIRASSRSFQAISLRFLVVDDSSLNRKMVIRMLEGDSRWPNLFICEANDGEEALQIVRDETNKGGRFDFILLDNIMLKMHGPEAARILRDDFKYKGIILGITGNVHPEQIADFIQHGANKVIPKPVSKAKLLDTIASYTVNGRLMDMNT